jgi:hypothetical protein
MTLRQAVTQFDPPKNKHMPAPRAGGLYKTRCQRGWPVFVEAVPPRVFRDGTGTFQIASPLQARAQLKLLTGKVK